MGRGENREINPHFHNISCIISFTPGHWPSAAETILQAIIVNFSWTEMYSKHHLFVPMSCILKQRVESEIIAIEISTWFDRRLEYAYNCIGLGKSQAEMRFIYSISIVKMFMERLWDETRCHDKQNVFLDKTKIYLYLDPGLRTELLPFKLM